MSNSLVQLLHATDVACEELVRLARERLETPFVPIDGVDVGQTIDELVPHRAAVLRRVEGRRDRAADHHAVDVLH
jgi:hypothetical protein